MLFSWITTVDKMLLTNSRQKAFPMPTHHFCRWDVEGSSRAASSICTCSLCPFLLVMPLLWLHNPLPASLATVQLSSRRTLTNAQLLYISLLLSKALGPGSWCVALRAVFWVLFVWFLFALLGFLALIACACGSQLVSEPR